MPNLQAKVLGKLQGVPVENRQDEILGYIRALQLSGSSDTGDSLLKRLFKVSNKPLMKAYLKSESATSFHEETEEMANTNTFPDTTLPFISNDNQSTPLENPTPQVMPLPIPKNTNHRSITVYWNKLFNRQKSQPKVEAPEPQKPIAVNEPADVQVQELQPETQSAKDLKNPLEESQEQQLAIEPVPDSFETKTPMMEPEAAQSNLPASDEVNLPIDQQQKHLKPKIPKKSSAKNVSEEPILSLFKLDHLPGAADSEKVESNPPASNDVNLPIIPRPDSLKPNTPKKRSAVNVSVEPILSPLEREHLSVAADSEEVEPKSPASNDVNLPIVPKPELLKPQTPKKSARNVSVDLTLGESNHLTAAAKPEDVKPNQPTFDPAEPKDAEANLPASDEVNMPIDQEPDRLKPTTPKKKTARNVSSEQTVSPFERHRLSVAAGQEDVEPNHPASDNVNLPIVPKPGLKPYLLQKRSARNVSDVTESNQFSVAVKQEDVKPIQPASDEINPNPMDLV
ncbi:hypothetical protein KR032_007643 [Drosophila birchii]|nr:hypothetical protein KR032_007643 [Drosophila birchii]